MTGKNITVDDSVVDVCKEAIVFPHNIRIFALNSSNESAEGYNIIAFICTEYAAFVNTEDQPNADSIFNVLYSSANTRFPGKFLGMLISYPRYNGDAILQKYDDAMEKKRRGDTSRPRIYAIKKSTWEFNPMRSRAEYESELTSNDPVVREAAYGKYLCEPGEKETKYIGDKAAILACVSGRQPIAQLETFEESVNGVLMGRLRISKFNISRQPSSVKYVARVDLGKSRDRACLCVGHLDGDKVVIDLIAHWVPDPNRKMIIDVDDPARLIVQLRNQLVSIVYCSYDQWNCLVGSTKISLLDGTEIAIRDLEGKEPFWVHSYDQSTGKIVPGLGRDARKTGVQADVYSVLIDNEEQIQATAEHLFMMSDGSYRKLKDLRPDDNLMSLYGRRELASLSAHGKGHKVVSTAYVGNQDVYDITVGDHHNFALSAGVFVHNSQSSLNVLNRNRIVTDILSLGPREYDVLLTNLAMRKVDLLNFAPLVDPKSGELFHLIRNKQTGKVDHEDGYHNDVSECVCGVVSMLKGTKKNMEDVPVGTSNVKSNLSDVSDNVWSDSTTEPNPFDNDEDDHLFTGEGFSLPM
ncbi:MAG: hypothetical protein A2Y38_01780 [Spirochaetes bacterium GWB1_59_5]|nr:MAG: hypothetical protein A2Y38_01780 [Spirochaetes bacterium GWB1_59_5]